MGSSIQEYCKKINRELTFVDVASLSLTFLFILFLVIFVTIQQKENVSQVVYKEGEIGSLVPKPDAGRPFGSRYGKTYTFSWCQGANRILDKNKVYFSSKESAEASGRTLSKLCQKK
jgi:hypothetical protein